VIGLERIEANMMRRHSHTDYQSAVYNRQRIPIDRLEVECGMVLRGSSVETSALTDDIASVRAGFGSRPFLFRRENRERL
jgi:hypothetical protein